MFSKTWRVHKIFTNKNAMKTVLMKDHWLFGYVAALVLIDVVILVSWEIIDPVVVKELSLNGKLTDVENDDIVYNTTQTTCQSVNHIYWIGSFYVINGLLLVFGAFLAWETRKVSFPALNDSKYIGICVYNVLILSFIGAAVSFVLVESSTHYSLVATLIWVATTITLCVVFVPKIKTRNAVLPAQNSNILTQNRVHSTNGQKELQLLREEIARMKENCKCLCDGGEATDVMYRELFNRSTTKIMILGAGCSIATEPTAQASHHWNLIQISYGSSSPKLSNRALFPRFFRLLSPESVYNIAKLAIFREFNWKKVATLHESVPLFSLSLADFHRDSKLRGIDIIAAESFVDNPTAQVAHIKELGARIIVGGFYSKMARRVFCAAYHQQMFGAKYVWILPGFRISRFSRVTSLTGFNSQ